MSDDSRKKPRILMAWLSYLTKSNRLDRIENYTASMNSLMKFVSNDDIEIIIVDNSNDGNDECERMRDSLRLPYKIFKAKNVCYDVAVHHVASYMSHLCGIEYFIYSYDDFVFFDHGFVGPSLKFMDEHSDVSCLRITKYDISKMKDYDRDLTPKTINPESVCHTYTKTGCGVVHIGPFHIKGYDFYESTWIANSRPTMWRLEDFERKVGYPAQCPIMQKYELYMKESIQSSRIWKSAFIDKGVCHTFKQSERISSGVERRGIKTDVRQLFDLLNSEENWI